MGRGKFLRVFSIAGLLWGWLVLFGIALSSACGEEREKGAVFSLAVKDERLDVVLERMSKASGYEITVNEGWRSRSVSTRLENVTLEEGIRAIIEELGRPSHLLVYDKGKRKIEIVLLGTSAAKTEFITKGEPPVALREQRQIVTPTPERTKPVLRPSLRRTRERPPRPIVSPEKTSDQAKPEEGGTEASPERKGPPDIEFEVSEAPGEGTESIERDETTPEAKAGRKATPQTPRRPAEGALEKPDSSGP